jgi:hypothetical protein
MLSKNSELLCIDDLIELGYKTATAKGFIHEAKKVMVDRGYSVYSNQRLGIVPRKVVEELLGVKLNS